MESSYDVVIVGGGIGGTAVGALLAHRGRKVLLLDKNGTIGGRCTSYEKDGFTVDLGVHLFGVGDRGSLGEVCRKVARPDAIEWVAIRQPVLRYRDEVKRYSRKTMQEMVPEAEMGNFGTLFATLFSLQEKELEELWYTPLSDWVDLFSRDPMVHGFINMICGQYFCIPSRAASTAEFIRCFREVVAARSSAYPRGGCIAIPRAYAKVITDCGGEVALKTPVRKILIETGRARGVELSDGTRILGSVIISNADIKETVLTLAGAEHFPAACVERVSKLTYAFPAVALKVALAEKITDDQLLLYIPYDYSEAFRVAQRTLETGEVPERVGGMITSPTNYDPSLAPEGRQMIFFGTACTGRKEWAPWEEALLDAFFRLYPGAQGKVLWHRLDTPDLVRAYAGEDGNIIGVGQSVDQIRDRRPAQVTPVRGLYLCSAEAGGHGIGTELAASSALELVSLLTGEHGLPRASSWWAS
ncbi:MAG: NAD(P)/FAD-dependent oxidoreductase [bacterium]